MLPYPENKVNRTERKNNKEQWRIDNGQWTIAESLTRSNKTSRSHNCQLSIFNCQSSKGHFYHKNSRSGWQKRYRVGQGSNDHRAADHALSAATRRIEMTLDRIRLATASTKGHFCSVLISNIYWLTSLSADSTITFSYPRSSRIHFFFINHSYLISEMLFRVGSFFSEISSCLRWPVRFPEILLRHAAPSLCSSVCLCLLPV